MNKSDRSLVLILGLCGLALVGGLYAEFVASDLALRIAIGVTITAVVAMTLLIVLRARARDVRDYIDSTLVGQVLDGTIDASICCDVDLKILAFNASAERILKLPRAEAIGQRISDLWPDQSQVDRLLGSMADLQMRDYPVADRIVQDFGYRVGGERFPMEISATRIEGPAGDRFVINIRDRSETDLSEHDRRRAYAFRTALLESSLSARLIINQNGEVVEYNRAAGETLGWTPDEMIGFSMAERIIPERYREAHRAGLKRYLETRNGPVIDQRIEISALHKSGNEFPIELTISPVEVDDQLYFSAEVRDISDRKQNEAEMEQAKLAAEASNEAKSNFLATMSHEIRTPLNAVIGILSLIRSETTDPRKLKLIKTAEKSGKNLLEIISDVLDYSKIEAGKMQVDDEAFSLADLMEESVELFAHSAFSKGLEVTTFFDPQLPESCLGDRSKVAQILKNFISNAIKFTDAGHISVAFDQADQSRWRFSVSDSGIGLSEEDQQTVFDAFVQVDSSDQRQFGGTGLGLSICRKLASLMGGTVSVAASSAGGCTFSCELPLAAFETTRLARPDARAVAVIGGGDYGRLELLRQLESLGFRSAQIDEPLGEQPLIVLMMPFDQARADVERWVRASQDRGEKPTVLLVDHKAPEEALLDVPYQHVRAPLMFPELLRLLRGDEEQLFAAPHLQHPDVEQRPLRVLLAEDSRSNQFVITTMLQSLGHHVDVVSNGIEAYSAVSSLPYDIVFMDVQMPDLDGLQATKQIRKLGGDAGEVPIVALTAKSFQEDLDACLTAGMNLYVTKPIDLERLKEVLDEFQADPNGGLSRAELAAEDSALNPGAVEQLKQLMSSDQVVMVLETFIEESRELIDATERSVRDGDRDGLGFSLHKLKSAAGSFGLNHLSQLAERGEGVAKSSEGTFGTEDLQRLNAAHAAGIDWLRSLITNMAGEK